MSREISVKIPSECVILVREGSMEEGTKILATFWEDAFTLETLAQFFELVKKEEVPSDRSLEVLYQMEHLEMSFGNYQLIKSDLI
jgi:hypothetical protein